MGVLIYLGGVGSLVALVILVCLFDRLRACHRFFRNRRAFWAALRRSRGLTAEQQQARRRILAGVLKRI